MRLPEIADRLREKAAVYGDEELLGLANAMSRRKPRGRAPATSIEFTPQIAARIREYKLRHPGMSQAAIAQIFNVNPGRVSEAVRGKRQ